jgi:hypothetical protein
MWIYNFILALHILLSYGIFVVKVHLSMNSSLSTIKVKRYKRDYHQYPFRGGCDSTLTEIYVPAPYSLMVNDADDNDAYYYVGEQKEMMELGVHDVEDIEVSLEWVEKCQAILKLQQDVVEKKINLSKETNNPLPVNQRILEHDEFLKWLDSAPRQ